MFIGHFGAGLAAKKIDPSPSLGTLFMAAQWIDLLWPFFLLLGWERVEIDPGNTAFTPLNFVHYPISHSLVGVLGWAIGFGVVYWALRKNRKGAVLLSGLVLSHWFLDLLVHRPDLPLLPDSDVMVGLGLWNHVAATVLLEGAIFLAGALLYLRTTRPRNTAGKYGTWGLLIFLGIVYVMNLLGPPPPSAEPIAVVGLAQWLLVALAYWIDRNRETVLPQIKDSKIVL